MGRTVVFSDHDIIGNDVVKADVIIEKLIAVVRDSARPAVILRDRGRSRHVAAMVDEVVISRKIIALPSGDAGAPGVTHRVPDKA